MIVLEVTADTANKLLAYLGSRPFIESADLIQLILNSKQVEKGEPAVNEQPAALQEVPAEQPAAEQPAAVESAPQENGSEERPEEAAAGSAS